VGEWVIQPAVGSGSEDNYAHSIVELLEDTATYWLMEMQLPIEREKV
jgi:hypothetical protein